jgi:hypothetical protein
MTQILDFGYGRPGAARVERREGDEQEAGDRKDDRSRPFVRVVIPEFAVEPGKQHEREQREEQEPAGGGYVRPLVGEVGSRLQNAQPPSTTQLERLNRSPNAM